MTQVRLRIGKLILLASAVLFLDQIAIADNCSPANEPAPSLGERAFLAADYDKAAGLFRANLAIRPNDAASVAGLARVLLHQQKPKDAGDVVELALKANEADKNALAVLLTTKAEVQLRAGLPWKAGPTLQAAQADDICVPRLHFVLARVAEMNSQYATARAQLNLAHKLDPFDPDIRRAWIGTLPLLDRIEELEKYLSSGSGDDAEVQHRLQLYLAHLKKIEKEPHKACRLVSSQTSTEIPLASLMSDATHIRAFGLDVNLNRRKAQLEIDTGANGLVLSKSVAGRAGLKPFSEADVDGVGDHGHKPSYTAFADSIQIGGLEFHDCAVLVVDNNRMGDIDGVIGMDVLGKFLVSLDYPGKKLTLSPLPTRPGEAVAAPSLGTDSSENVDAAKSGSASKPDTETNKTMTTAETSQPKADAPTGPFDRYIAPEMMDYTPVYRVGHALMLPVALNQSKVKLFILDTGSWRTTVSPEAAREVTRIHADTTSDVRGLNGKVDAVYEADEITFAFGHLAQEIHEVPAIDTSKLSKDFGMEISGLLGASTLELTTIHIDYRDGLVKFDYGPRKAHTSN